VFSCAAQSANISIGIDILELGFELKALQNALPEAKTIATHYPPSVAVCNYRRIKEAIWQIVY
jgi:hypothetical protein